MPLTTYTALLPVVTWSATAASTFPSPSKSPAAIAVAPGSPVLLVFVTKPSLLLT
ncbi:MAG TPA: hypothetical protein VHB97_06485 [Polyangia bacterium]|nr:hypothetical protein [Polyangia bacterium]